jgi:ATP-dependent DNA helicase RecG
VLVISVPPGLPHVYSLEGRFLGREGSQTNPLPARRLRQLLLERGVIQFESRVPTATAIEDLDPVQISTYVQALNFPGDGGLESQIEILVRRGCIKRVGGTLQPTYAGLFSAAPAVLPMPAC